VRVAGRALVGPHASVEFAWVYIVFADAVLVLGLALRLGANHNIGDVGNPLAQLLLEL
jgi:hypothetical protein